MAIKLTKIMIKEKFNRGMCIGTVKAMDHVLIEEAQVGFHRELKQENMKVKEKGEKNGSISISDNLKKSLTKLGQLFQRKGKADLLLPQLFGS